MTAGHGLKHPAHGSDHEQVTRGNWLSVNLPYRGTARSGLESDPRTSRKENQRSLIEPYLKVSLDAEPSDCLHLTIASDIFSTHHQKRLTTAEFHNCTHSSMENRTQIQE